VRQQLITSMWVLKFKRRDMIADLIPQAVTACVTTSACVGFTVRGVRDPDSWRATTDPLLFDANYDPKPV
jgi:GH35 family endo-1,4-beta-xylanase